MSIISSLVDAFHGKQEPRPAAPPPPPVAPAAAHAAPAPSAWNPLQSVGSAFSSLLKHNPLTAPHTDAASAPAGDKKAADSAGKTDGGFFSSMAHKVGGWFGAKADAGPKTDGAPAASTGAGLGTAATSGGNPFAGAKAGATASAAVGAVQGSGNTQGVQGQTATPQADPNKPADPAAAPQTKAPPDPKQIAADANALGKAMDSFLFTDKKGVADTLRGKSAEEIALIKDEYRKHFGRELDADINKKIGTSSDDPLAKEVKASLEGNPTKSYMESIQRASKGGWFGGADKDKLKSILAGMDDKTRAEVRAQFKGPGGESLDQLVGDKLKGSDLNEARAYLDGNKAAADAAKIDEKMHGGLFGRGGFLGIGLGRDNKGIEQIVDSQKDKEALRKAYQSQTQQNLDKDITKDLSGTQKNITEAVLGGNKSAADAGRVKQATEGWFTDKNAIYKAMEGKKPEEILKMKEEYNKVYGTQKGGVTGGEMGTVGALTLVGSPLAPIAAFDALRKHRSDGMDFDTMLSSNMSGLDLEKAHRLEKEGKVSDAFALKYAMHSGFFTDKAEVKRILGGKDGDGLSKPELDKLRQEFTEEQKRDPNYKPGDKIVDLDTDVRKNTGSLKDRWGSQSDNKAANSGEFLLGRDGLEIRQMLRGKATTVDEQAERANETYEMERHSGIPGASKLFDSFNGRGKTLDRQNQLMNSTLAKLKNGTATDEDRKELQAILGRHKMDVTSYQETKDSVSNAAAATAAITISAAATIATGGGASPLLAASIAAAAGTGAAVTKMALQGGAYSYDDARSDLMNTAVQAGTAGIMKLPAIDKALNSMVGIAPGVTGTLTQQVAKESLSSAGSAALTSLGTTAVNPATYQGDPNQAFWGALRTAGASALGSGVTGGLNKYLGSSVPKTYGNSFMTGVASTAAGTATTNLLNPSGVTGSQGDQAASWVTTLLGGGVGNMASLKVERNQAAAAAQKQQDEGHLPTKTPTETTEEAKAPNKTAHADTEEKPAATVNSGHPESEEKPATTAKSGHPESEEKPATTTKSGHLESEEKPVTTAKSGTESEEKPAAATKPVSEEEKPIAEMKKQATTTEEKAVAKSFEERAAELRKKGDVEALRQLAAETRDRRTNGKGRDRIVSVEDVRQMQEWAKELGVDPRSVSIPKASSVEETLRAKGMTDDEMKLYKGSLNRNQQSTMTEEERQTYSKADRPIDPKAGSTDAKGAVRDAADPAMLKALLKANILLFEDVQPGMLITKVIGDAEGQTKYTKMRGDVGLNRNTEGMTPKQKVEFLGLDYKGSKFVQDGKHGPEVADGSRQKIAQVEQRLTPEQVEKLQVPMGFDLYKAAVADREARLMQLQTQHPGKPATELEAMLPKMLQQAPTETGEMEFKHIQLRPRFETDDPSAGFGYTASQGMRDKDGKQFFRPNQELTFGTNSQDITPGGQVQELDSQKKVTPYATLENGAWQK